MSSGLIGKDANGFAVPMQRAHVDVDIAALDAVRASTIPQVSVDQGSEIFVRATAPQPQILQLEEVPPWHLERTPNPLGCGIRVLYLYLFHSPVVVGYDGVKQFGPFHWEQEKRQFSIGKKFIPLKRKPDGIGKSNIDFVFWREEGGGAKKSITQSAGGLLDDIADRSSAELSAEVADDIGFSRRDYKTHAI